MTLGNYDWNDFYKAIDGREVRPLLLDALALIPANDNDSPLQAIDLGFGDGTETAELLRRGWRVLAVDGEPGAVEYLMRKIPASYHDHLQTQVAKFQDVVLPQADLVYSSYSLPFCPPEHFSEMWRKISTALEPAGVFSGNFFGVHDQWADNPGMTFLTETLVREMFSDFEVHSFHVMDDIGEAVGGPKHWHLFPVIAQKNNAS